MYLTFSCVTCCQTFPPPFPPPNQILAILPPESWHPGATNHGTEPTTEMSESTIQLRGSFPPGIPPLPATSRGVAWHVTGLGAIKRRAHHADRAPRTVNLQRCIKHFVQRMKTFSARMKTYFQPLFVAKLVGVWGCCRARVFADRLTPPTRWAGLW